MENQLTTLVNIHKKTPYDVYIGRAGKGHDGYFGNPIPLCGKDRQFVLDAYKKYFYARLEIDNDFKERIQSLKGKTLGCFCFPELCHGMVIIEYLDGITPEQQLENYRKEQNTDLF